MTRGASPAALLMAVLCLALSYMAWTANMRPPTLLERIKQDGELVVVTRLGPSTYYHSGERDLGMEYDLARAFARELGLDLRIVIAEDLNQVFEILDSRRAHIAAAGLAVTEARRKRYDFSVPYMSVRQQLVYRAGARRPATLLELEEPVLVSPGSSHAEYIRRTALKLPGLDWAIDPLASSEELLYRVWNREIPYTIAHSNELTLHQRFLPELRAAFDLTKPQGIAWALPDYRDDSLKQAADRFFRRIREDGTLTHLMEKYYGHLARFDYVGTLTFTRHVTERLPKYRALFEQAAREHGLDWRLLAAIGYQESHWDPRAVSPTGVRGLMMLTLNTASHVGISNRLDPAQSIEGGARYLAEMKARVPQHLQEPVRTWMALAAYNVGLGHLEDARVLTQELGGDPNSWFSVQKHLPLLAQRKYYSRTRYGYARGWEPVTYVQNVRSYYDLLIRITEPDLLRVESSEAVPERPVYLAPEDPPVRLVSPLDSLF
ncbi:membrane-bound lytic murein transglycosylase MltF [Alkalilimnicola sp. S0819]|uniref:membrane-bound lytic murein transglycosylase MltF n=1 Tax=Alkalilimnicola sp. S0819 TaxID=2613922 RepID=UPI00126236F2|nr:membrane-bound lytic murein transglycosylase MltF [Alkalilimnicola sp. S0819]KAB7627467.1 membrane-bound lytic murein transglycosylase MltF [Alkalilimnicola sp. S0819]MPQ15619.1 membrane-bound lytic murein transglycosylase MltF [Alkalilimnicola sp. S0819]